MPLLQAQFIQPNVGDHTLGIDLSILGQLILDDPVYRLGRDSQATGNLLRRAADQRTEHELLEAISVGYVLAFERGDNVLPVVTPRTAMEGSLVNPETGLLPQVEVPDRLGACFELDVGDVVVATFFTTASCGQGPPHLQAMAVLIPLVTGDFHLGNKVDIDGDPSHGPSVIRDQRRLLMHANKRTGYDKTVKNPRPRTLKRKNPKKARSTGPGRDSNRSRAISRIRYAAPGQRARRGIGRATGRTLRHGPRGPRPGPQGRDTISSGIVPRMRLPRTRFCRVPSLITICEAIPPPGISKVAQNSPNPNRLS